MRYKMSHPINWGNGMIATPREMLDRGLAEVRVAEKFGRKLRRAVFVDLKGEMIGVEVSGYVAAQQ